MNATVNENCIGCGLCAGTCPVVFSMGDDGLAHGGEIPDNQRAEAETARDGCPVSAIRIKNETQEKGGGETLPRRREEGGGGKG